MPSTKIVFCDKDGSVVYSQEERYQFKSYQMLKGHVKIILDGMDKSIVDFKIMDETWTNPIEFSERQAAYHLMEVADPTTPGATREEAITTEPLFNAKAAFADSPFITDSAYTMSPDAVMSYLKSCSIHTSAVSVGALTQSSGWGKSKLMSAICEKYRQPYICFPAKKAVPSQTAFAKQCLLSLFEDHRAADTVATLQCLIARFLDYVSANAKHKHGSEFFQFFFTPMIDGISTPTIDDLANAATKLQNAAKAYTNAMEVDYVLLLVDEAAWLLLDDNLSLDKISAFRVFRRALAIKGITALFAATNSAVQNFMPALHHEAENSLKEDEGNEADDMADSLTQGICNVGPLDLFARIPWNEGLSLYEVFEPKRLAAFGRPLWSALINHSEPMPDDRLLGKLLSYAARKLQVKLQPSGHLAAIACITSLYGMNPGRLSDSFVKSHMATLRAISSDRTTLYTTYVTEPLLQIAAVHEIFKRPATITTLQSHLSNGLMSIGHVGELIARLLLVLIRYPDVTTPISVQKYASSLFGRSYSTGKREFISLTHWVVWDEDLSQRCLFDAFIRTAGLLTCVNEKGIDMVIPVAVPKGRTKKITADQMTAILIQVKNRGSVVKADVVFDSMRKTSIFRALKDNQMRPYCWLLQKGKKSVKGQDNLHQVDSRFKDLAPSLQQNIRELLVTTILDIHSDAPEMTVGSRDILAIGNRWRALTHMGCYTSLNFEPQAPIEEGSDRGEEELQPTAEEPEHAEQYCATTRRKRRRDE